jgi:hypothetical protein
VLPPWMPFVVHGLGLRLGRYRQESQKPDLELEGYPKSECRWLTHVKTSCPTAKQSEW